MAKILIIEDEAKLADTLAYNIREEGHEALVVLDGLAGLEKARSESPNLIILDLMLPKMDGLEVCRLVRRDSDVPIIMLTAKSRELDKVVGLEIGADDYVTKPFSMVEMLARIKATLRRSRTQVRQTEVIRAGDLEMDVARHLVSINGSIVDLRPKEFELLRVLLVNKARVLNRTTLLQLVWGEDEYIDAGTVDVHIRRLREKIEADPGNPSRVLTVRGLGYKYAE
ncbi:MAG: response regulator transcription factor [Armatimonadota bacterium]|nr:response regulator transcription factor [bacterium]